ncbi:MAG: FKBP-type peptidyl-prolyl cis-trans isomerase [Armatimonadetes bacterium]|nr:FKBP-type peptidyl-prolyl cis-trans isomerase [Armatimonadota bacterium]
MFLTAATLCIALAAAPATFDVIAPTTGETFSKDDVVTIAFKVTDSKTGVEVSNNLNQIPIAFMVGKEPATKVAEEAMKGMKVGGDRLVRGSKDWKSLLGDKASDDLSIEIQVLRIDRKDKPADLDIKSIKQGTGGEVKEGDDVSFHYTGTFLTGFKFDSSKDRNEPLAVQAGKGQLIPGFDKTLLGMRVGEIRTVTIPWQMAYGERGAGSVIPPYSTLVFTIELVKIGK